mmetsp:Transcript_19833/g.42557  ORF Transcript_19833/g.42557 Transcript_19833/m.42557 type:complete len:596 (+) Transcript_19833:154-1941(+)|eukprot:CAMPEP_0172575286 /NCGR_PEP_ID=MMETSP1067-20121228/137138_1 /TAXON_ID=265564 ORGANISM="Thalassiosira punctigera, Strain Tpunct2005C2" /NCGR_SAMPLE_ID=MMETSP1067 /ASSEMBLY_ACC=CAM_ASM_000444 /LENGTH=595 /DNA_ID=CAMNT_0013367935 /DNA_START=1875 /DNA_END=3662 /DNA_ORIENTATION=+
MITTLAAAAALSFSFVCLGSPEVFGFAHPQRSYYYYYQHHTTQAFFSTKIDAPIKREEFLPTSSPEIQQALQSLASTTLALLSGDEDAASSLIGGASQKKHIVAKIFEGYDVCGSGTLSAGEARALFADLARSMVLELSKGSSGEEDDFSEDIYVKAAQAHARRVLADDEAGNTIDRVARKLLLMADTDGDKRINLQELAQLFDTVFEANLGSTENGDELFEDGNSTTKRKSMVPSGTFPQPLRALAGSLQLLPPRERAIASEAAERSALWNVGVPGDDHTLRRVILEDGDEASMKKKKRKKSNSLSLIGLGRSADASAYFIPELGIALDAGLHVSSLKPKSVLLTHGHRDHIGALPVHASYGALILVPKKIKKLVHNFLVAEAQLNYGEITTEEQTLEALGGFNLVGTTDGTRIMLPKDKYMGSPTPIGVNCLSAPHKEGVPANSYGIFRQKQRLKKEYQGMSKSELGALLRTKRSAGKDEKELTITESYDEGILFYTGDTTITLLRERWREICRAYKYIIHEATFLGPPSSDLDSSVRAKGHTHYAQLHPWICAFPTRTFILVHWSLRYEKEEVLEFFRNNYGGVPKNVVLWL